VRIDPEQLADRLRSCGVQATAQRLAVLGAAAALPHGTAEEIERHVRAELGAISRQTVYDALGALTEHRLLRRIQLAGSPSRYEHRVDDDHHHLVCRSCGRTVDVECAGPVPGLAAPDDARHEVDDAELVFWGRCADCVTAAATGTG
jgi:Fur family ferric uptake transcriptional regulator